MRRSSWTGVALFAIGFAGCSSYFWAARSHPPQSADASAKDKPAAAERNNEPVPAPSASKLAAPATTSVPQAVAPPTVPTPGPVEKWVSVLSTDESDQNRRLAVATLRTLGVTEGDANHVIRNALIRAMDDGTEVAPSARAAFDAIEAASASPR